MKNASINLAELFGKQVKQDERMLHKSPMNIFEFYLCGEIESPEEYIQWFDTIRHASANDVIKIYINSPGGDVFSAIQFMRVLGDTDATVVISIEGACMSAATMIMLAGDVYEISDHSMVMVHNYSSGVMGKGGEMFDQLQHQKSWSEKMMREIYAGFLTEKEIVAILDNKDIWMDGEEAIKRLEKRNMKMKSDEKKATKLANKTVDISSEKV